MSLVVILIKKFLISDVLICLCYFILVFWFEVVDGVGLGVFIVSFLG